MKWVFVGVFLVCLSVAGFFVVGLILLAVVDVDKARESREHWQFEGSEADAV